MSQAGRQLVVTIVWLMKRLNLITLSNNMKVYIIYRKDGYGEQVVDKAFSSHEKACQYIIEKEFRRNDYYKKFSDDELMREAAAFVTEEEVI
jgi:hypothetical protein